MKAKTQKPAAKKAAVAAKPSKTKKPAVAAKSSKTKKAATAKAK